MISEAAILQKITRQPKQEAGFKQLVRELCARGHGTVVGTFHYGDRYNYVTPIDEKITQEIVIPQGQEWPESEEERQKEKGRKQGAEDRHRVIGTEAHRRKPQPHRETQAESEWDDLDGVVVDVEITSWPGPTQNPRGRVLEIIGYE